MSSRGKPSKDRPYCWEEKAVRRAIREVFDADGQKASALGIYGALCEIASNEQSDTFTASHDKIASFAGLGGKTSKRIMPTFEKMKIVHVRRNGSDGLQTSSTYTLLSCPSKFRPQGLKVPAQGQQSKSDLSHVLNESSEESPEKSDDDIANGEKPSAESSSSNSDWIKEAEKDELFPQFAAFAKTLNEKGWKTWRSKHSPKPKPKPATKSPRLPEPKRVQPPMDPIAEADFQRRLAEWKAKGRPLGEWSEISMGGNSHAER